MAFDLALFRGLAFGKREGPDHPLANEQEVRNMVESLPRADPAAALAEMTHWAVSINENTSFAPEQRAQVFMEMDVAAHQFWRPLGAEYLAPAGTPTEGRDGDRALLQALQESAAEFATGFALCLEPEALKSRWIRANLVAVMLRRARWLTRKMILARMLNLPGAADRWAELHAMYRLASEHDVFKAAGVVFPGNPRTSSVRQEYVRMLLVDITRPDRLLGRDIEFMYRIIGRVAAAVRLEPEPIQGALHVVVPEASQLPVALSRLGGKAPAGALYLDSANALPRLKALAERNMDRDPSEADPQFGEVFTIRERRALIAVLMDQWSGGARQRRAQRVALKDRVSLYNGFEQLAKLVEPLDQGGFAQPGGKGTALRIQFDEAEAKAKAARAAHVAREVKGQLYDASATGMGVRVRRKEAPWAKLGALLSVRIEPGKDWAIGVLRRMNADGEDLRLGLSILSRKPRLAWFHLDATGHTTVWDEERIRDRDFLEHFQRGVLLEGDGSQAGELVLAAGIASKGTRFDLPLAKGMHRLVVTAVREQTHDFQRVAFEPQPVKK